MVSGKKVVKFVQALITKFKMILNIDEEYQTGRARGFNLITHYSF